MIDSRLVDEIVDRMVELLSPERVILFDPAADGERDGDSDLDVLVVTDAEDDERTAEELAFWALADMPIDVDVVVLSPAEFESLRGQDGTYAQRVYALGLHAYDAGGPGTRPPDATPSDRTATGD